MIIFETPFGSHLFGTNTPSSDHDYKGVYIPSKEEILLPRIPDVRSFNTGSKTEKNSSEDVDRELYAVHKFFDMLAKGDMVATEVLFAPLNNTATVNWRWIIDNRHKLISNKCKGFVGYVQRQANTYGVKGDRYNEIKDIIDFLYETIAVYGPGKISDIETFETNFKKFCEGRKFTTWEMLPNQHKEYFHMVCCDRKVPTTVSFKEALYVYENVLNQYGARAKAAATSSGIDWKAISHAVRIGEEAIELLTTGFITFPRPNAHRLLNIKLGNEKYEAIAEELDMLLGRVETESFDSTLPNSVDIKWMNTTREEFYYNMVMGKI